MTKFYVKMEQVIESNEYQFRIEYWCNTDLRDFEFTKDIPTIKIYNWVRN